MAPLLASLLLLLSLSFSEDLTPKADFVLGKRVPDVVLTTSEGTQAKLSDLSRGKPLLMSFVYTRCTSSCPVIVQRLKRALSELGRSDYTVLLVDFDERDSVSELRDFVKQRGIEEPNWKVVLARGDELTRLTRAVDFKFYYDDKTDMFAHPNVLVVVSPDMRVSGYVLGLSYDPDKLSSLITSAASGRISLNPIKGLLLKCFRYDPITGTYSIDWSFVAMLLGGSLPLALMFYFVVFKNVVTGIRRFPA